MIGNAIVPFPKPAVYLSGGLDSTIILHHLREKYDSKIYTYTASFNLDGDETNWAKMVAEHYGTKHCTVDCSGFLDDLVEIMKGFTHPRYNVWAYYLAKQAKKDGRENIYLGEGADEQFGGYTEGSYLELWADYFTYHKSMFEELHHLMGLSVHFPFSDIDWRKTLPYHSPPNKFHLVQAYKDIIPNFIVEGRGKAPPSFTNYWQFWYRFFKNKYPNFRPKNVEDIRRFFRYLATKAWLEANKGDYECEE